MKSRSILLLSPSLLSCLLFQSSSCASIAAKPFHWNLPRGGGQHRQGNVTTIITNEKSSLLLPLLWNTNNNDRPNWRKQVEQSLFEQMRHHNARTSTNQVHVTTSTTTCEESLSASQTYKEMISDPIINDWMNPLIEKEEEPHFGQTISNSNSYALNAALSLTQLHLKPTPNPLEIPQKEDINIGIVSRNIILIFLTAAAMQWNATPATPSTPATPATTKTIRRKKVTKIRKVPRRTILYDLQDDQNDLDQDEFELLLLDLQLPSFLEEEYTVYDEEEVPDDDQIILTTPLDDDDSSASEYNDEEEINAFLKASNTPESWQIETDFYDEFDSYYEYDQILRDNDLSECLDLEWDHNISMLEAVDETVSQTTQSNETNPLDDRPLVTSALTEPQLNHRSQCPPPPPPTEDDDFFNDLELKLLDETHIKFEINWHREEESEYDMDEEDWRVLLDSMRKIDDTFTSFLEDDNEERFDNDGDCTDFENMDQYQSVPLIKGTMGSDDVSFGESELLNASGEDTAVGLATFVPPPPPLHRCIPTLPCQTDSTDVFETVPRVRPPPPPRRNLPPPPPMQSATIIPHAYLPGTYKQQGQIYYPPPPRHSFQPPPPRKTETMVRDPNRSGTQLEGHSVIHSPPTHRRYIPPPPPQKQSMIPRPN